MSDYSGHEVWLARLTNHLETERYSATTMARWMTWIGAMRPSAFATTRPVPHPNLPLLPEVGEAILQYLQKSRPKTAFREVFIRCCAPYRPFKGGSNLGRLVRRWFEDAGANTKGKRGPHAFRHARAVSMLRAAVPLNPEMRWVDRRHRPLPAAPGGGPSICGAFPGGRMGRIGYLVSPVTSP